MKNRVIRKIKHERRNKDAWICVCGNIPEGSGFYPVNSKGQECEPTEKDWDTNNYKCGECGIIIDQDTLEIIPDLKGKARIVLECRFKKSCPVTEAEVEEFLKMVPEKQIEDTYKKLPAACK